MCCLSVALVGSTVTGGKNAMVTWDDKYKEFKALLEQHSDPRSLATIFQVTRFLRQHGAKHLVSWVQRLPVRWKAHCLAQLRPFVNPPPPLPKHKPLTPRQAELVWELGFPLDPMGGLPYRVLECKHPGLQRLTSRGRWWRFVHDALRKDSLRETLDSICMARRTKPKQPTRAWKQSVPAQHHDLASKIVKVHAQKERSHKELERRDMIATTKSPLGRAYVKCIQRTLRQHRVQQDRTITDPALLLSSPGCGKQRVHLDYATHPYCGALWPYSCMLVLDNSTPSKLHVFQDEKEAVMYVCSHAFGCKGE